ncbi:MAG: winged helix-turn-helix transcriptional regulator [Candidatus Riflebacteria bacterium]|nr:winged helix-turn-helix transcriptional regulator [Candidatus Riflebacteria bacterium]
MIRGVEKITKACKKAGLPKPIIIERSGGVAVELLKAEPSESAVSNSRGNDFATVSENVSGKRRENVGKTSGIILDACRENPSITITEMAEKIGITERSVQRNIQKLQFEGFLRRVGGRKEGYWQIIESN